MNKKTKNIILFLVGLAILLAGTSYMVRPSNGDNYDILAVRRKVSAMETEPENSLDVLFLGDSESCDVYSPVQLWGEYGFASYNTGSRAQRIVDAYAILTEELKRQSPKLIIIEANTLFRKDDVYNTTDFGQYFAERIFPIAHYHSIYKLLPMQELISGYYNEMARAESLKGFWLRTKSVPYTGRTDYMNNDVNMAEIQPGTEAYLKKTVELAKASGANVLLVASPSPKNWTKGRCLAIDQWANENGVDYLDLNEMQDEIGLNWHTDSLDHGDHVNLSGSKKVNTYLGKWIQEVYDLPDHRNENSYQAWNDLYRTTEAYQKII